MMLAQIIFTIIFLLPLAIADYQGDVLYALKMSLIGPPNVLSDWNQNQVSPCTWSSVNCANNNVISVTLSSMGFSGTLTPKIGDLRTLTSLVLQGNNITGQIPKELGNLSSLTNLDLENNRFTGRIPDSLGNLTKLSFLILSQNNLEGPIPESLSKLSNLINIQLAFNRFSGVIPNSLFLVHKYK